VILSTEGQKTLVCGHTILLLCGGSDDTDESGGLELAGCVTNILVEMCDLLHCYTL